LVERQPSKLNVAGSRPVSRSTPGLCSWRVSEFVPEYAYKSATPKDGYAEPYGDYFEIDIDGHGKTQAIWGEGISYNGPGNVWFSRQP
jgi:hypothetical protein